MTGIHRPVVLYTVPSFIHLTDVTLATDVTKDLNSAAIYYQIEHKSSPSEIAEECRVEIQGGHTCHRTPNTIFAKIDGSNVTFGKMLAIKVSCIS